MSKIAFFCIPAQGHTNPTLEVVKELVRRGHQVRYYSYNILREKIEATGAAFISCDAYDMQMNLTPEDGERIAKDIAFSTEIMVKMTLAMDDTIISEMAQWQPDCIVADSMATWGKLAALKLGIPLMSSTTTFAFNRYSAKIMKQSLADTARMLSAMPKANKFVKQLRQKGYPVKNVLDLIANDNETNTIVYTSPQFQPCAETFSEHYTFVGPSVKAQAAPTEPLDSADPAKPIEPAEPAEPINSAEPVAKTPRRTVYISLGTVNNLKVDFYRRCLQALGDTELEVIMSVGEYIDLRELGDLPANFTAVPRVNQLEVLQKAAVFLTHCGMNSVNEALYYSVPLVLFPQTPEQNGVAYRVNELGAGLYLQNDAPETIRQAIFTVLQNPSYQESAAEISRDFRQCGGYQLAADKIEGLIK